MRFISLAGLIGALIGCAFFSWITAIPVGIPTFIWFFSIFGGAVTLMVVIELLILTYQAFRYS